MEALTTLLPKAPNEINPSASRNRDIDELK
jgi:hypothetical protein